MHMWREFEPSAGGRVAAFAAKAVRRRLLPLIVLLPALLSSGCGREGGTASAQTKPEPAGFAAADIHTPDFRAVVAEFCGQCHAPPDPALMPRIRWEAEVDRGFGFFHDKYRSRSDRPPAPDQALVTAFFEAHAPDGLEFDVPAWTADLDDAFRPVETASADATDGAKGAVSISHLRWWEPADGPPRLLACDMRNGEILAFEWADDGFDKRVLAKVDFPAHVEPTDLDGDGRPDFVVASLGSFWPEDHDRGRVVWLRPDDETGESTAVTLFDGVGRIADVRPADFDGDGRIDLVVAEFGYLETGSLRLLMQTGLDERGVPKFRELVLDARHGWSHVPIGDLDGDGRPDFVGLVSQEFESVVAFLNRGGGTFEERVLFEAGDPSFGFSGIELADLDGDGDLDVLATNGDHFDGFVLHPAHSVFWLENMNGASFTRHELGRLPGAYKAVAADFTGNGLLDVAAVGFIPSGVWNDVSGAVRQTLVWYEQTAPREFVERVIERDDRSASLALQAADIDGDGRVDLVIGAFDADELDEAEKRVFRFETRTRRAPPLRVFRNARAEAGR
ncbi:MAG: VCBS repeat-containing protein [Planctomycetaceae bacterium]